MAYRKFGRNADHRKAMLRNMATSVIVNGSIETTELKAKDLRSVVDELITLAKRGDLHARRQAASYIRDVVADETTGTTALQKLFMKLVLNMQTVTVDTLQLLKLVTVVGTMLQWQSLN